MPHTKIVLTAHDIDHHKQQLVFEDHARVMIGRSKDCEVRLPADELHSDVSRHHCMLEIAPHCLKLSDLGSRNGTYVNGEKIGQRAPDYLTDDSPLEPQEVKDGDEIRVGSTRFVVHVENVGEEETDIELDFYSPFEELLTGYQSSSQF